MVFPSTGGNCMSDQLPSSNFSLCMVSPPTATSTPEEVTNKRKTTTTYYLNRWPECYDANKPIMLLLKTARTGYLTVYIVFHRHSWNIKIICFPSHRMLLCQGQKASRRYASIYSQTVDWFVVSRWSLQIWTIGFASWWNMIYKLRWYHLAQSRSTLLVHPPSWQAWPVSTLDYYSKQEWFRFSFPDR